jgi:hypothetical protein
MTKKDSFEKDFDFEKEYGFDPNTILDPEFENEEAMKTSFDASFDQTFIKEFDAKFDEEFDSRFTATFGGEFSEALKQETEEAPEEIQATEPAFDLANFDESIIDQSAFEAAAAESDADAGDEVPADGEPAAEAVEIPQGEAPAEAPVNPRRKPLSRERMIKEVYLPPIIAGVAALLCLIFIVGGVSRVVRNYIDDRNQGIIDAENAANEKTRLQAESERLLREAALLAAGYDYQGAVDKLNSFSDAANMDKYSEMIDKRAEYSALKNQLQGWNEPSSIANLSFQMLVVDTDRAYNDYKYKQQYKDNFVTVAEFEKILNQLYEKGYVLVDFDSFVTETVAEDGSVTFGTTPIYLPSGKTPIMLSQTMVNYMNYMLATDEADTDGGYGDGFASKLVVRNGEIVAEYMDANGNTMYGEYDLVPILNRFIEEHPDFSYKGARAILAVTGDEGLFGYRTMPSVIEAKGQAYYDEQVAGAKEIIEALRNQGYTIACYTYANKDYNSYSATEIQADMDLWTKEVTPILGECDTIIFAKGTDISTSTNYEGNKFRVLSSKGFRYFIGASQVPWGEVNPTYVRQTRVMVTGKDMTNAASTFTKFFDAKSILDSARTASAE